MDPDKRKAELTLLKFTELLENVIDNSRNNDVGNNIPRSVDIPTLTPTESLEEIFEPFEYTPTPSQEEEPELKPKPKKKKKKKIDPLIEEEEEPEPEEEELGEEEELEKFGDFYDIFGKFSPTSSQHQNQKRLLEARALITDLPQEDIIKNSDQINFSHTMIIRQFMDAVKIFLINKGSTIYDIWTFTYFLNNSKEVDTILKRLEDALIFYSFLNYNNALKYSIRIKKIYYKKFIDESYLEKWKFISEDDSIQNISKILEGIRKKYKKFHHEFIKDFFGDEPEKWNFLNIGFIGYEKRKKLDLLELMNKYIMSGIEYGKILSTGTKYTLILKKEGEEEKVYVELRTKFIEYYDEFNILQRIREIIPYEGNHISYYDKDSENPFFFIFDCFKKVTLDFLLRNRLLSDEGGSSTEIKNLLYRDYTPIQFLSDIKYENYGYKKFYWYTDSFTFNEYYNMTVDEKDRNRFDGFNNKNFLSYEKFIWGLGLSFFKDFFDSKGEIIHRSVDNPANKDLFEKNTVLGNLSNSLYSLNMDTLSILFDENSVMQKLFRKYFYLGESGQPCEIFIDEQYRDEDPENIVEKLIMKKFNDITLTPENPPLHTIICINNSGLFYDNLKFPVNLGFNNSFEEVLIDDMGWNRHRKFLNSKKLSELKTHRNIPIDLQLKHVWIPFTDPDYQNVLKGNGRYYARLIFAIKKHGNRYSWVEIPVFNKNSVKTYHNYDQQKDVITYGNGSIIDVVYAFYEILIFKPHEAPLRMATNPNTQFTGDLFKLLL